MANINITAFLIVQKELNIFLGLETLMLYTYLIMYESIKEGYTRNAVQIYMSLFVMVKKNLQRYLQEVADKETVIIYLV